MQFELLPRDIAPHWLQVSKLDLNELKLINYKPLSQYPFIKFDLSFSVPVDFSAYLIVDEINKLLSNKYTIYDRTLPRLKSDCVNTKCITNLKIDLNKTFMVDNLPEISEEINEIFQDDDDKIERKIPMKLTSMLIILKDEDDLEGLKEKYNGKKN